MGFATLHVCMAWPCAAMAEDARVDMLERQLGEVQPARPNWKAAEPPLQAALQAVQRGAAAACMRLRQRLGAQPRVTIAKGRFEWW